MVSHSDQLSAATVSAKEGVSCCITRRAAFVGGIAFAINGGSGTAQAADPQAARMQRPKRGDKLVFAGGEKANAAITANDLVLGGKQVLAWALDPETQTVRDGSRLNQILVLRLDEATFNESTRKCAAGGVVAYSAICPHALCPVTDWIKERQILHCPCHNSEYNPREGAAVLGGPTQRPLASLPLEQDAEFLIVAQPFIGRVGAQQV